MSKPSTEVRQGYRATRRNIRFGRKPQGKGNTKPHERRAFWHAWMDAVRADEEAQSA